MNADKMSLMNDDLTEFPLLRLGKGAPRTLTSAVFQQLRADLICCRLMPGQKLPLMPLAKSFRVSLAAVRGALSRPAAEGLVVAMDQRGFMVSETSIADLIDVTEARIDIETIALRRAIEKGDNAWEKNIEIAWRMLEAMPYPQSSEPSAEYDRWSQLHDRFHASLISACDSLWLLKVPCDPLRAERALPSPRAPVSFGQPRYFRRASEHHGGRTVSRCGRCGAGFGGSLLVDSRDSENPSRRRSSGDAGSGFSRRCARSNAWAESIVTV